MNGKDDLFFGVTVPLALFFIEVLLSHIKPITSILLESFAFFGIKGCAIVIINYHMDFNLINLIQHINNIFISRSVNYGSIHPFNDVIQYRYYSNILRW